MQTPLHLPDGYEQVNKEWNQNDCTHMEVMVGQKTPVPNAG